MICLTMTGETGWEVGAAPIRLYQSHHGAVSSWHAAERGVRRMGLSEEHARAELSKTRARYEDRLREIRSDLRERDLLVPPLPPELRHVDDDRAGEFGGFDEFHSTIEESSGGDVR
ncbi:hypothetical protein DMB38_19705 [Streptomyces sp. WAC 06738]|nr:hypothetical protein DMB38_19705 [Streptomyces sp. WAC 06738]